MISQFLGRNRSPDADSSNHKLEVFETSFQKLLGDITLIFFLIAPLSTSGLVRAEADRAVYLHLAGSIITDAISLMIPSWPIWQQHLYSLWAIVSALLP